MAAICFIIAPSSLLGQGVAKLPRTKDVICEIKARLRMGRHEEEGMLKIKEKKFSMSNLDKKGRRAGSFCLGYVAGATA